MSAAKVGTVRITHQLMLRMLCMDLLCLKPLQLGTRLLLCSCTPFCLTLSCCKQLLSLLTPILSCCKVLSQLPLSRMQTGCLCLYLC